MKITRAMLMILASLLAGGVAVWLAASWVSQQASENSVKVVVATTAIEAGAPIAPQSITLSNWPKGHVPAGAFTDLKKLSGRVSNTPIYTGEAILAAKLAPEGTSGGLSATIQPSKRAITLQVNEIVGVAGYIRPGSLVDVIVNSREGETRPVSKIILEKILVLAAAQDDKRDQTKPKVVSTVTLEVTPEQAEKIDLARNIGTISLALRNPLDTTESATRGAYREDVFRVTQASAGASSPASSPASTPVATASSAPGADTARRPASYRSTKPVAKPEPSGVEVIRGVQKANAPIEESK